MQTALTCKEALSIVQVEAADTIASTTRKGNQKKRVANPLPIQSSPPCERTPKLCTHSQERRQTIRPKLQTNWAKKSRKSCDEDANLLPSSDSSWSLHKSSARFRNSVRDLFCLESHWSWQRQEDRPSPILDKAQVTRRQPDEIHPTSVYRGIFLYIRRWSRCSLRARSHGSRVLSPKYDMEKTFWKWGCGLVLRVGLSKKIRPNPHHKSREYFFMK